MSGSGIVTGGGGHQRIEVGDGGNGWPTRRIKAD